MKNLLLLLFLIPAFATAQINGTIQKTVATGTVRGSFGSAGIDTLPRVTGVLLNGVPLIYNSATNKYTTTKVGLSGIDTTQIRTVANSVSLAGLQTRLNGYVPTSRTVAGFALSSNVTLADLSATNSTLTFSGAYNGSTARTAGLNLSNANTWLAKQTFNARAQGAFIANKEVGVDGTVRAGSQLELNNITTGGHTIMTMYNNLANDESAVEAWGMLSDSTDYQMMANFTRFVNANNTFSNYSTVNGTHLVDNNEDNTPFLAYSNNSVKLLAGSTSGLPWNTMPSANTVEITNPGILKVTTINGFTDLALNGDGANALFLQNSSTGNTIANTGGGRFSIGTASPSSVTKFQVSENTGVGNHAGYFEQNGLGNGLQITTSSTSSNAFIANMRSVGVNRFYVLNDGTIGASSLAGTGARMVVADSTGRVSTQAIPGGGGGSVTGVAVATANGFTGTSDGASVVPTLTLGTTVTGVLLGNGTGVSALNYAITNTPSTLVYRDTSGNFGAGTITAALTGNASTATALQTARTISGTSFDGTSNITLNNTGITNGAGYITSSALSPYAPLASPALTGTPTAPTAAAGTNTTQLATTAFVSNAISATTSGTITPVVTGVSNVGSVGSSPLSLIYIRVGNRVFFEGIIPVTPTTAGAVTQVRISLPVASNFTGAYDAIGNSTEYGNANAKNGTIESDSVNDALLLTYDCITTVTTSIYINGAYTII